MSIDLFLFYFYHASYVHQGNKSHLHLVPYILFISVVQVSQGTSSTHTYLVPFVSIFVFYSNLGNKLQFQLVPLLLLFWFINTTQGTSHVIFDLFPICNYSCPLCHSGNKLCYQLACSPSTFFYFYFSLREQAMPPSTLFLLYIITCYLCTLGYKSTSTLFPIFDYPCY